MALNLKIVKGHGPNERMKSIDGILNSLDKKLQTRTPDEKLKKEVVELKQTITVLLDFLGLAMEPGPKKVIRRVRIADETNTIDTL